MWYIYGIYKIYDAKMHNKGCDNVRKLYDKSRKNMNYMIIIV